MGSTDEADARGFLRPYAEGFSIPRAWRFSVAGVIGAAADVRVPARHGACSVSAGTGRYGLAGTVFGRQRPWQRVLRPAAWAG